MNTSVAVLFLHECPVRLWGLTSRERLRRIFAAKGVTRFLTDRDHLPTDGTVVVIREDYLYDDRVISGLLDHPGTILEISRAGTTVPVAAHVTAAAAGQVSAWLEQGRLPAADDQGIKRLTPGELASKYLQRLRKFDQPFVLPITEQYRQQLEKHLFSWSYKGVTDLVTKWVWPAAARLAVRFCVRRGLRPNQVTLAGFFLALAAGFLFYYGWYGTGLLAGWLMTFLDTVDGKLARVTVTSSKFGHLFDHAIDIIHPPLWYLAWGLGLRRCGLPLTPGAWQLLLWLILGGYLGGRLVEAIFTQFLGRFGIFCWQPRDSYFRLITGRRNPNMILLTISFIFGRPDLGLWAVAVWTALSTLYLVYRLYRALQARKAGKPLQAWFETIDPEKARSSFTVRIFTRRPTVLPDGSRG